MKQTASTRLLVRLKALAGQEGIYREGGLIKHVRIEQLTIDDGALNLQLAPLTTQGFSSRADTPFQASVSLEFLIAHLNYLAAPLVNWCLVTDPQATAYLVELARSGVETDALQEAYIRLRRHFFSMPAESRHMP